MPNVSTSLVSGPNVAAAATTSSTPLLKDPAASDTDRNIAIAMHLTPLLGFMIIGPFSVLVPIILWLVKRSTSPFADDHGREVINAMISYVLFSLLLAITVIGPIVLFFIAVVNVIRGAVASGNGEYFRYPMTIRFL